MPYLPRSVVVIRNLAIKGIKPDGKLAKSADALEDENNRFVMHFSLNDPIVDEDKLQAEKGAKKLAPNATLNLDQKKKSDVDEFVRPPVSISTRDG